MALPVSLFHERQLRYCGGIRRLVRAGCPLDAKFCVKSLGLILRLALRACPTEQ